ncbi:MAG: sugar phosphate isomerase/epimerase family protein [Desulfovibrionaceae bacterium]
MSHAIGFIQGRLSPMVDGRIQAFPWDAWRDEFPAAQALGIACMEWTLDQHRLRENPLMTEDGREEIRALSAAHGLRIPTLTGDNFMQAPFYKAQGATRDNLLMDAADVVAACGALGIGVIVVPLVDNGSVTTEEEAAALLDGVEALAPLLREQGVRIAFESDYPPDDLAAFIACFDPQTCGINYDIGNSAALGYDCRAEVAAYGGRIIGVHVKDRLRGGTTVPLGTGAADLPGAVAALAGAGFAGPWIMQTARAADGDHAGALGRYRDMVRGWLAAAGV